MKVIVLGAGIIGISTAWHLLEQGHEVTVVDRQDASAMETSFANAGQISVSYCEPWANPEAPLKLIKWMLRKDAPLLFRPTLDWQQWRWGLQFLSQCTQGAFERNVQQLVALGSYSHAALKTWCAHGIEYNRSAASRTISRTKICQRRRGCHPDAAPWHRAARGEPRQLLAIEPALRPFAPDRQGAPTRPATNRRRVFTQALAALCRRGAHAVRHACCA
jgi:D-amino-acid dehydrogenase